MPLPKIAACGGFMKSNQQKSRAASMEQDPVHKPRYIEYGALCVLFMAAVSLMVLPAISLDAMQEKTEYIVYTGTYTDGAGKGIYGFRFQPSTGTLTSTGLMAESVHPSFLVIHPNRQFLFAANEVSSFNGKNGTISSFKIAPDTGCLTFMNRVSSEGTHPCHITVDKTGKWLLAANYSSGSLAVFPVNEDGTLGSASDTVQHEGSGANRMRQEGPHAHAVILSPDNRFLLAPDLGIDKVMIYRFNAVNGTLEPNDPPFFRVHPGSGPRHLSFHPNGRLAYLINELDSSLTALAFDPDTGILREINTVSTLPGSYTGFNTTAEVQVHPNGKFVYGSNRGDDSIAVFRSDDSRGTMKAVGFVPTAGKTPRYFAIDPTGRFLFAANQDSGNIVLFRIDAESGRLSKTGTVLDTPKPVCIVFLPVR
jgi:6-phosphogluconolactonase